MSKAEPLIHDGRRVVIRPAQVGDAAAIVHAFDAVAREKRWFLRDSFSETAEAEAEFIANLDPEKVAFFVALVGDDLVGWLILSRGAAEYIRHTAEIGIGVVKPYRRAGIGTALLLAAIDWAKSKGIERLCLGVRGANERARRLYTKLGFVEEGRRRRHVKTPSGYDDEVLMALFL